MMQVKLKILGGSSAGKEIPLPVGKLLIGRGEECQLRPKSDAISRRHCELIVDKEKVTIADLGSRNGTHVNGEKTQGVHVLKSGDLLRVGPLEFELQIEQSAAPAPTATAPPAAATKQAPAKTSATAAALAGASKKAPTSSSDSSVADDDVSRWLEEGDSVDRESRLADPETRQFKITVDPVSETKSAKAERDTELEAEKPTKRSWFGGKGDKKPAPKPAAKPAPSSSGDASKDSRGAAADMLKKFFNNRPTNP